MFRLIHDSIVDTFGRLTRCYPASMESIDLRELSSEEETSRAGTDDQDVY
jgi:hypothetical protein